MVANWVDPLVRTIYSIVSFGATAIATVLCPPAVPFLSVGFAIGGAGLGFIPMKGTEAEEQQARFMEGIRNSLEGINQTVWENQDLIEGNQDLLRDNQHILNTIQGMLNVNAEESRQMIKGLHATLQQFESNMNDKFEELQVFMIEKSFNEKILQKINMVWYLMNKAMQSQKRSDVKKFKFHFNAIRPRAILLRFALGLESPTTNPIVSAMEYNVLKSRLIMENYMHLYSHLVVKVLAMEGFYYGLTEGIKSATALLSIENKSKSFLHKMSRTVETALNKFIAHVSSYKLKEEKYWPGAINKTIIESTAVISNGASNTGKLADSIKQKLDGIYTRDVFSIYVYNCLNEHHISSYDCTPLPFMSFHTDDIGTPSYLERMTRFMAKAEKNNYHIVVLRSKTSKDIDKTTIGMVRLNFHTYTQLLAPLEERNPIQSIKENIGKDAFLTTLDSYFVQKSNLVNGFITYGKITPEIRFTNNGSSVLSVGKGNLPHKFYGLNWI